MPYTYILHSASLDKFYVGVCHKNLESRIESHNTGKYGPKTFTSQTNDWQLFVGFECEDYPHAIRLERKIKSMKSRKYIKNLNCYPEMREKVFNETKNT